MSLLMLLISESLVRRIRDDVTKFVEGEGELEFCVSKCGGLRRTKGTYTFADETTGREVEERRIERCSKICESVDIWHEARSPRELASRYERPYTLAHRLS
jgi:hypothetical protein